MGLLRTSQESCFPKRPFQRGGLHVQAAGWCAGLVRLGAFSPPVQWIGVSDLELGGTRAG